MYDIKTENVPFEADIRELLSAFYFAEEEADAPKVYACEDNGCYIFEMRYPDGTFNRFRTDIMDSRFATKCELKRNLYLEFGNHEGHGLPWGTLTGIRPTKLVLNGIEKIKENADGSQESVRTADERISGMKKDFEREYLSSKEKTDLCFETAEREAEVLSRFDYENGWSLYAGIPFCPSRCLYCSFTAYPIGIWKDKKQKYLDALKKEIREVSDCMKGSPLHTVYIGGGTPTSLEDDELKDLVAYIKECNDTSSLLELTVEAGRPDSITEEKLKALKECGVSRISINPQSMNQKTLDLIGRRHTVEDVNEKFHIARELGFDNINMDIIVGLPGENVDDVRRTMEALTKLRPDDITVHSLALKRAARLSEEKDSYGTLTFDETSKMMDVAKHACLEMNLRPYYLYRQKNMAGNFENVGYCSEGHEGIYNILIMEEKQRIIGCGAGTTTKLPINGGLDGVKRIENVKDPQVYIERIDEMLARKREIEKWH